MSQAVCPSALHRRETAISALIVATGVMAGAFGAHALKKILSPELLSVYEKAVHYQLFHGLALFVWPLLGAAQSCTPSQIRRVWLMLLSATILFSGSLYLYVLSGERLFAMITPIGGSLYIIGWVYIAAVLAFSNGLPESKHSEAK